MTTTIRITCRNNSDARSFSLLDGLAKSRHNGGKLVIAQVELSDLAEVKARLDDSGTVSTYEVAGE